MKRRQLLISSFAGFGLAILGKKYHAQIAKSAEGFAIPLTPQDAELITTLSASEPIFRIAVVGDTGTGDRGQYAVANAMTRYYQQHPFDFVILAGDNIYNYGEIEKVTEVFEKPYQKLLETGVKFRACLGNHDIATNNGEDELNYAGFNMPSRYYTFRHKTLQFFALDTNVNANWQQQLPWLEKELSRSDAEGKIVFAHHPIYSAGLHGGNQNLERILTPLFQKYHVALYLNGHDHNYERTRAINGTTYLTCGAGSSIRMVGRSRMTAYSASQLSFAVLNVYPDHILINAIDTDNKIFDQGLFLLRPV